MYSENAKLTNCGNLQRAKIDIVAKWVIPLDIIVKSFLKSA